MISGTSLPRIKINQATCGVEKDHPSKTSLFIENEQKKLKEAGIQEVKFQEQEYVKRTKATAWKWVEMKFPESSKKLTELFSKK